MAKQSVSWWNVEAFQSLQPSFPKLCDYQINNRNTEERVHDEGDHPLFGIAIDSIDQILTISIRQNNNYWLIMLNNGPELLDVIARFALLISRIQVSYIQ